MNELNQVSLTSIIFMTVTAVFCFLTPIIIMIIVKIKTKASLFPTLIGAAIFILFSLVLENISHYFFLIQDSPLSRFVNNNTFLYALYSGVAAGLFEETGRFVAFKFFLKKHVGKITSITYGIGHGGIEAILIGGLAMVNAIATSIMINTQGINGVLAMVPEASKEATKTSLESLINTPSHSFLLTYGERLVAIVLHISLSVLVFVAVRNIRKRYLFFVAIFLHALIDVIAVFFQKGIVSNVWILEGVFAVYAIAVAVFAYTVYKKE